MIGGAVAIGDEDLSLLVGGRRERLDQGGIRTNFLVDVQLRKNALAIDGYIEDAGACRREVGLRKMQQNSVGRAGLQSRDGVSELPVPF